MLGSNSHPHYIIFLDSPKNILEGLGNIIVSSDILLVDYIEIGGLPATLINVMLVTISSIVLAYFLGLKLNGTLIAGALRPSVFPSLEKTSLISGQFILVVFYIPKCKKLITKIFLQL